MREQITQTILMVEPIGFHFNAQTAVNNYFQENTQASQDEIQKQALVEFTHMVAELRSKGIEVIVVKDTPEPQTPDSIFPNNWISMHKEGKVVIYPMFAPNRRLEKRMEVLEILEEKGFKIDQIIDYSSAEEEDVFLEGTGSIIIDRENALAYAALSERTNEELFLEYCEELDYTPVVFKANQTVKEQRLPIYHTNVMMCVAKTYVVICLDTLDDEVERRYLLDCFAKTGKDVIEITEAQMHQFAGNMLQVQNKDGQPYLVMSKTAFDSLTPAQVKALEAHNPLITPNVATIEKLGGGSVRCMMAEVFSPRS